MIAVSVILLFGVIASLILLLVVTLRHKNNYLWCKEKMAVAKNGTGHFSSIAAAVKATPNNSPSKFCIFIGQGEYNENVIVGPEKKNIVLIGDGVGNTTMKSNKTLQDTLPLATLHIEGSRFIAKYITFNNSAELSNGQAVALKSTSERSAFYQRRFEDYQETLHVNWGTQVYRECEIYGTIDLIFENARVVFQNGDNFHNLEKGHSNVITAQWRERLASPTGISIQHCKIREANDFNSHLGIRTYLGRPWKPFLRVVIMQSFLGDIIDPQG